MAITISEAVIVSRNSSGVSNTSSNLGVLIVLV